MQTWYYSKNGEQKGPVSEEELRALLSGNQLNPQTDLAWSEGMANWQPVGSISALASGPPSLSASGSDFNPYAAPATSPEKLLASAPEGALNEIAPGSMPLEVMQCVQRGFTLTMRHFGVILMIGVVYMGISFGVGLVEGVISTMLVGIEATSEGQAAFHPAMIPVKLATALISVIMAAGLSRASLNICSGKEATVGQLFGEFSKLPSIIGGSILFYLMLFAGLILLIVPGIWVALRFGFFLTAIVDRNLGPIEALKYSYKITDNNSFNLLGLWLMLMLVGLAGVIALLVGLVVAIPVVTLAIVLAYRFLQYGPPALQDLEGTTTPMLAGTVRGAN